MSDKSNKKVEKENKKNNKNNFYFICFGFKKFFIFSFALTDLSEITSVFQRKSIIIIIIINIIINIIL